MEPPFKVFPDTWSNDRFWAKVNIGPPKECWDWTGYKHSKGYGVHSWGGRQERASRIVLFGPGIQTPLLALHHCDNPSCVNPKHLFAGSAQDNNEDCVRKGRRTRTYKK